jgi:hypothetical protein
MKSWTEVSPYTGIEEDAPANNASSGDVSMPPDAVKKKKKTLIDRQMMDARTKSYREHRARLEARRLARETARNKSRFIEKVKEDVMSEVAYGQGYDTIKPVADIQPVNAQKSATGRPRGAPHIENVRFWDLSDEELRYIKKDAGEAMKANPKARKAISGPGNWADQVNDALTVLGWRKKKGIKK